MPRRELTELEHRTARAICEQQHGAEMTAQLTADPDADVWPPCPDCRAAVIALVDAAAVPEITEEDVEYLRSLTAQAATAGWQTQARYARILALCEWRVREYAAMTEAPDAK